MAKQDNLSLFEADNIINAVKEDADILKEKIIDLKTKQKPKTDFKIISPSLIGMLSECPRCLWSHYNEGIKRPEGIFPSLPSGMDNIIKTYFDNYRTKNELPPEISKEIKGRLFQDMTLLQDWRCNWRGIKYQFDEYRMILRGAIDELIVSPEDKLIPFDFKTRGFPLKEDTHVHYQSQLDLYGLLFEKNGYKVAKYGYLLFFWPQSYKENNTIFNTKLVKIEISPNNGLNLIRKTYEILNSPKPQISSDCQYCQYKNSKL